MMNPPSVGPRVGATMTATPYRAKAWPRCSGAKLSARIDCSLGARPPPPIPCRIRNVISHPSEGASPQSSELAPKTPTQIM